MLNEKLFPMRVSYIQRFSSTASSCRRRLGMVIYIHKSTYTDVGKHTRAHRAQAGTHPITASRPRHRQPS